MLTFHSRMIALVNFIQLTCQTLLIFFLILRWGLRWKANHRRANFWEKEMLKQKKLFLLSATANANSYCLCLLHRVCLLPSFVHPCLKKWFNTKRSDDSDKSYSPHSLYLEVKGLLVLAWEGGRKKVSLCKWRDAVLFSPSTSTLNPWAG